MFRGRAVQGRERRHVRIDRHARRRQLVGERRARALDERLWHGAGDRCIRQAVSESRRDLVSDDDELCRGRSVRGFGRQHLRADRDARVGLMERGGGARAIVGPGVGGGGELDSRRWLGELDRHRLSERDELCRGGHVHRRGRQHARPRRTVVERRVGTDRGDRAGDKCARNRAGIHNLRRGTRDVQRRCLSGRWDLCRGRQLQRLEPLRLRLDRRAVRVDVVSERGSRTLDERIRCRSG